MLFYFSDLDNNFEDKYPVVFICCRYPIFANMVVDRCHKYCKGKITVDISEYKEFLSSSEDNGGGEDNLEFETFKDYVSGRKAIGKWYSKVEYDLLSKQQIDEMFDYLRYPSENGLLVITVRDWRNIKKIVSNSFYNGSRKIAVFNLGFPNHNLLSRIITDIFKKRGVTIKKEAVALFITRMGNNYNGYSEQLERIINENKSGEVNYKQMLSYMSGVYNFAIDDYIDGILKPIKADKVAITRKSYKVLKSLLNEYTPLQVVNRVRRRVEALVEYRTLINTGILPVEGIYEPKKIQESLPETSLVKTASTYSFRNSAELAAKTTLKDWYLILYMLAGVKNDAEAMKTLLSVANRSIYNKNRLLNNLRISNIIDSELLTLNSCKPRETMNNDTFFETK